MRGKKHVATSREREIASNLSSSRAIVFLESRGYIRESLSSLFRIDPLKIPIVANPGEPPKLPPDMGHISISHCNDALVVVWYQDRIGIDIERSDRNFNHENLEKKYFLEDLNPLQIPSSREEILKQWSAIEAAIKWDKGKLARDIKQWHYSKKGKNLLHKKKNINVQLTQIDFYEWIISIAYMWENKDYDSKIICSIL